jgi:hypothetical protein
VHVYGLRAASQPRKVRGVRQCKSAPARVPACLFNDRSGPGTAACLTGSYVVRQPSEGLMMMMRKLSRPISTMTCHCAPEKAFRVVAVLAARASPMLPGLSCSCVTLQQHRRRVAGEAGRLQQSRVQVSTPRRLESANRMLRLAGPPSHYYSPNSVSMHH